ncbi:MAG: hypothetical protein IPN63_09590 [Gammaproteobacteria bacterium]|nr:hypothetical protein [Gammaproteobacteria bacterium]
MPTLNWIGKDAVVRHHQEVPFRLKAQAAGLGGGSQFCRLSAEPLFDADGQIRRDLSFAQLAEFVWFAETGAGFPPSPQPSPMLGEGVNLPSPSMGARANLPSSSMGEGTNLPSPLAGEGSGERGRSPLLGSHEGRAIHLPYNGILKDKSMVGGNVLTGSVFDLLPPFAGPKAIYAAANRMGARTARAGVTFKQTPYALTV